MLTRRTLLATALLPVAARAATPLKVVATFSILADLVATLGAGRVTVTALVAPDQDTHAFQPRPSDAQAIAAADLFVANGLGLEGWAGRLATAAGTRRAPVIATTGLHPLKSAAHGQDPHAWQNAAHVKLYTTNIRDGLIAADPAGADAYQAAAPTYLARLDRLDADIKAALAPIPRANRRIVTSHDAFGYYAAAYGIDFLAPQGLDSDAEPSAKELAALIAQIRREKIRALFLENITNPKLLEQVARETGVRIGGTVYSDALSPPTGPAATYETMMRHNTTLFAAALR